MLPVLPIPGPAIRRVAKEPVLRRTLSLEGTLSISDLTRALGKPSERSWTVFALFSTLFSWFPARSAEARRFSGERNGFSIAVQRLQCEIASLSNHSRL